MSRRELIAWCLWKEDVCAGDADLRVFGGVYVNSSPFHSG